MSEAMAYVYSHMNVALVWNIRNVLLSHGIECMVRHDHLVGAAGELAPIDCWPEVWVSEHDQSEATKLIEQVMSEPLKQESWYCDVCDEELPAQFDICWCCEQVRSQHETDG